MPVDDSWDWDGTEWTPVSTSQLPPLRDAPAVVVFDAPVLFGGVRLTTIFNDAWRLDRDAGWEPLTLQNPPSPRYAISMVFDSVSNRAVLFGGQLEDGGYSGETWLLE
jgi:hypothetical protein